MSYMPMCPNGHSVAPGNVFCHQCGATVAADDRTAVRPISPMDDTTSHEPVPAAPNDTVLRPEPVQPPVAPPFDPGPPTLPPPLAMNGGYESPRHHNNTLIYAIAGLVIVVAIAAVAAVLLMKNSGGNSGQTSQNPITNPTLPATATPTVPSPSLPAGTQVVVSDCNGASSSQPSQLQLQCSNPGAALANITWASWTPQSAIGTGTYYAPTGAGENTTNSPVSIQMVQPVSGASGYEFSQVIVTPASGPAVTWVQSTPGGTWSSSSQVKGAMPAGGTLCPGLIKGKYQFGTMGSNTSCGFVRAVYNAWESSGNQSPVTATSPATHETYKNIVCTVDSTQSWATCVGGRKNSARMFFALP